MKKAIIVLSALGMFLFSCKKSDSTSTSGSAAPSLIFKFKFDSTQARLNNLGQPSTIPANHRTQSPKFNTISSHYIELAPSGLTAVGAGTVLYHAPETTTGGTNAIDFSKSNIVTEGSTFLSIPLSSITPGTYQYLRVSLSYQNYDIKVRASGYDLVTTLASFIGFNTYITSYKIKNQTITGINANKLQGYWGAETTFLSTPYTSTGQPPPGSVTVPNPIWATSPIPPGSCLVTGPFTTPLTITGTENHDIVITMSLSTNNSFEWKENAGNNLYEPTAGDTVTDMGIRGLVPIVTP